jgi:hypothetical protein
MREEHTDEDCENTIRLLPSHNGSILDKTGLLESPRLRTMAEEVGRRDSSSRRKQRSIGINTKTALLSIIAASPVAMAQNCISLSGSTQCPAFQSASISTDSTLVGFLSVVSN